MLLKFESCHARFRLSRTNCRYHLLTLCTADRLPSSVTSLRTVGVDTNCFMKLSKITIWIYLSFPMLDKQQGPLSATKQHNTCLVNLVIKIIGGDQSNCANDYNDSNTFCVRNKVEGRISFRKQTGTDHSFSPYAKWYTSQSLNIP